MSMPDPAGIAGAAAAVALAALSAWSLERLVGGWLTAYERELAAAGEPVAPARTDTRWLAAGALAALVIATWGWEVVALGLEPRGIDGPLDAGRWSPFVRFVAHSILLWFLAAATWIDLRHRVIPDWVTVTGFLAALVGTWLQPAILLPITAEVARPLAPPRIVPDLLAAGGPLGTPEGRPPAVMLAIAAAMFVAWWWIATGPDGAVAGDEPSPVEADGAGRTVAGAVSSPRFLLLLVGLAALAVAWWWGGARFSALMASLTGAVVGGGVVWATRAGASAALGREAMGMGDATLMAMVGAWIGWQGCVLACFFGVLVGLVHGLAQIVSQRGNELPFGPSLCAGTVLVVAAWRPLWALGGETFAEPLLLAAVVACVVVGTAASLWVWSRLPDRGRRVLLGVVLAGLGALLGWLLVLGGPAG